MTATAATPAATGRARLSTGKPATLSRSMASSSACHEGSGRGAGTVRSARSARASGASGASVRPGNAAAGRSAPLALAGASLRARPRSASRCRISSTEAGPMFSMSRSC